MRPGARAGAAQESSTTHLEEERNATVDRRIDGVVDVERPEVLLYVPKGDRLKLVGVEYMAVDADQDPATADDRPALFGRAFDGPMWNPKLRCPGT